jgi:hypothetical protein
METLRNCLNPGSFPNFLEQQTKQNGRTHFVTTLFIPRRTAAMSHAMQKLVVTNTWIKVAEIKRITGPALG